MRASYVLIRLFSGMGNKVRSRSFGWGGGGLDWRGVEWSGVEWIGMEWSGLEWIGLEWAGLVYPTKLNHGLYMPGET